MTLKLLKSENPSARFPRLDTVLFLEEFIKKYDVSNIFYNLRLFDNIWESICRCRRENRVDFLPKRCRKTA